MASWDMQAEAADDVMPAKSAPPGAITVRTENYPRPPYSGATYYIYERDRRTICTKLAVCNKFDQCDLKYMAGLFKDPEDIETGAPYGSTSAVVIPGSLLRKHVCLTKFGLAGPR